MVGPVHEPSPVSLRNILKTISEDFFLKPGKSTAHHKVILTTLKLKADFVGIQTGHRNYKLI